MEQTALAKISNYLQSESIKERFSEVVGDRNAAAYIASVMLAVANDDSGNLRKCTPASIYISALRAATLRLSVDPSTGQAYLVPFGEHASLLVGYKGLYDMAVRTNKYRYINVPKRYEGETTTPDPISGLITAAGLGGSKTSDKIIGYIGAFEMYGGFSKTIYMTVEEIHEHARTYSKAYNSTKSLWQSKKRHDVEAMESKTVLRRLLRRWGYLDPADVSNLEMAESDADDASSIERVQESLPMLSEEVKPESSEVNTALEEQAKASEAELLQQLGY
jgi:recombination protein RecT